MATDKKLGLEEVLDQLYAASPEDFVRLRNEQAKELKSAGHEDDAAEVKSLARPTVVAWALNQLVRRAPKEVDALIQAGQEVERAHRRLLSGVETHHLQAAVKHRRELLAAMEERAATILEESGRASDPHRAGIATTLQTASVEREAAEFLRAGRFTKELPPPSGFGNLTGLALLPREDSGRRVSPAQVSARHAREERAATVHPLKRARDDERERAAEAKRARDAERERAAEAKRARDAERERAAEAKRAGEAERRRRLLARERSAEAKRHAQVTSRRADAAEKRALKAADDATRAEERARRARALAEKLQSEAENLRAQAASAQREAESLGPD